MQPWEFPRLYPVIDNAACESRHLDPRDVADACFSGGARLLQLRVKAGSSASFLSIADAVVAIAKPFDATVIVNDRADVARLAGAGGVHVGQEDLPPDAVRVFFPDAIVGLSTHDESQVDAALTSSADYIAVGPIHGTATKDTGYTARGLGLVRYAAGRGKAVVAIGGITLESAAPVIEAGASAVAVITDLLAGGTREIEKRVRQYLGALA